MQRTSLHSALPFVFVLSLAAVLAGCNPFDPPIKPPGDEETLGRDTRMKMIAFFAKAYEDKQLSNYSECLHPDYKFCFWEDNTGDPDWLLGDWIGKQKDVEITQNMFSSPEVKDIRAEFTNQTSVEGATDDEGRFWERVVVDGGNTFTVYEADFAVDLSVFTEGDGTEINHWVDGRAEIFLRRDPFDPDLWVIWKIEDRGNQAKAGGESWGEVKESFR